MKRFLTILLATLALSAALCVSASASSFDGAARELSTIGMLKGTADGFDLDKAPTRAQAAIMLVRLYGAEERAQGLYSSGRITCPFADVNETAAPYVAWLVDEGLANGITETSFGAAEPCTAKAYTIFLLRALGYQDKEDFTTANAQEFAQSLGLLDTSALTGTFLRDDLVALTYQALGTDMKDGKMYLLEHLIEDCELDVSGARTLTKKIEYYRDINSASSALREGVSAKINLNMEMDVSRIAPGDTQPSGEIERVALACGGDVKLAMKRYPEMALDLTMKADGQEENVKLWLKGDWVYAQTGEASVKMETGEEIWKLLEDSAQKEAGASLLPFVADISKQASGDEAVYTMDMNDAYESLVKDITAQVLEANHVSGSAGGEMDMKGFTIRYTVKGGTLKSVSADTALSMKIDGGEAEGTVMAGMSMDMKMDILSSGSAVKISFPDFSDFEEVIGGADGPTGISGILAS
ncbi:MAG: S-layer homology domain-containing protein [Oscillibacter sp.]|uniref:S-layer homology domain-containing protein n=1 Tax=uncultured Oscillibacter sp. TaxID=876091 RepID=UPI0021743447|nr:S-layer homology domain-containing protein [uncultured Oscillibacter sp.]MCI9643313.1 S-layer homology domain-containing protein [Oscillibacter sp.]